jgi:hypothetical protein
VKSSGSPSRRIAGANPSGQQSDIGAPPLILRHDPPHHTQTWLMVPRTRSRKLKSHSIRLSMKAVKSIWHLTGPGGPYLRGLTARPFDPHGPGGGYSFPAETGKRHLETGSSPGFAAWRSSLKQATPATRALPFVMSHNAVSSQSGGDQPVMLHG